MKITGKLNIFIFAFLVLLANAYAQSPRDELQQMVEQLQETPTDHVLREKIILLAPTLNPSPGLPDAAIAFEGRGQFAFRGATSEGDFLAAAQEYEKAVAAAPWVPGYYADLCTIYEKAGRFEDAKRHCGFYLTALTDPAQMTDVKRRIAGLEFGIEKIANEKRRAAEEANSPRGRAAAMLAFLNKQYAGPVRKLLICGVNLNDYWYCTDEDARGLNWVNSVGMNNYPAPRPGTAEFKIVGAGSDLIEMNLGTYLQAGFGPFRTGCAKPNGVDPNSMTWVNCPSWEKAGQPMNVEVRFMTGANGSPLIEYRDSLPCDARGCRRAQFTLQPNL